MAYWYSKDVIFRLRVRVASAAMTKTMNKIALMMVVARGFAVIIALMATRTPILMRLTHHWLRNWLWLGLGLRLRLWLSLGR